MDISNSADQRDIVDMSNQPKKHLFLPSGNFIWEIKSKKYNNSYFVDSKREYCTCKGYYYNFKAKQGCYHLDKISESLSGLRYKIYVYHDDFFKLFLRRIVIGTFKSD
ncbi:MAG: hypothetical protein M3Y25_01420 [Thermoproteota archaeon]|nr:hypothetical protein [Thermoproteota archaeon]